LKAFPSMHFVRKRAAHRIDSRYYRQNVIKVGGSTGRIGEYLAGRTYGATVEGALHTITIDRNALAYMSAIKDSVYACLRDAESALKAAYLSKQPVAEGPHSAARR